MFILERTRLACRILHHLATCPGGVAKQVDLARAVSAPNPYTGKVARELLAAGFVRSVRGYHGGFALALPASSIRVGDVVEFIEDKRGWSSQQQTETAYITSVLRDARQALVDVLNECSMADLCVEANRDMARSERQARRCRNSGGRSGSESAQSAKVVMAGSAQS